MDDWLAARANASPQALALLIGERQWTYAELHSLVSGMASYLSSSVQPGQPVALLLPNNLAYVCLIHALARIGALLVPLNTRLTTHELAWQLDHVGCTLLIASEEMADQASILATEGRRLLWAQKLLVREAVAQQNQANEKGTFPLLTTSDWKTRRPLYSHRALPGVQKGLYCPSPITFGARLRPLSAWACKITIAGCVVCRYFM